MNKLLVCQTPQKYDENCIVLMVRDPHSLFTYWELTKVQTDRISRLLNIPWIEVPLFLRLYEVTGLKFDGINAHKYHDIGINHLADNWYLEAVTANVSYCVDLGSKDADGRFFVILRSNIVRTPRATMADIGEGELVLAYIRQQSTDTPEQKTFSSKDCIANGR